MRPEQKPRIIYNDDNCGLRVVPPPHTIDQISSAMDYMRDSQVDCVSWFMASDVAYAYDSDVIDSVNDLYERDPGFVPAANSLEKNLPLSLHKQGIDYLPLLIDHFHDADISFYGSIRMNDAHHKSKPDGWLASDFWKAHQDWRLWEVEDGFSYYNATLDYSYPEVRKRRIETVREILERYDVDGIELDFCRNPYVFEPSEAWAKRQILTDFIATISELTNGYSVKKGREIGLMVRVPFEEAKHERAGMDIHQWLEDGLLDILVMSHGSNNYNARIEPWQSLCRKHGVWFYPSVDSDPKLNPYPETVLPKGVLPPQHNANMRIGEHADVMAKCTRAMAGNYLAQKPDGIYMFNYPCKLYEGGVQSPADFKKMAFVLSEIGDAETLVDKDKLYFFSHHLPIYVEAGRPAHCHQRIPFCMRDPDLNEKHKVTLSFRRVAARNPHSYVASIGPVLPGDYMQTLLNGKVLDEHLFVKTEDEMATIPSGFSNIGRHERIEIVLNGNDLICGENILAFHIPHFPREEDPYVYIYELTVQTRPIIS